MAQDLEIKQTDRGATRCVKLIGKMTETADYSGIDVSKCEAAEFDFAGVTMINSKGVQIWKEFMRGLTSSMRLVYVQCPLKVVNQLNLFPAFKGGKTVEVASFFAPYYCEPCDLPRAVLLDTARDFPGGRVANPPIANCPQCKNLLGFDGNAQKFFLFLKRVS